MVVVVRRRERSARLPLEVASKLRPSRSEVSQARRKKEIRESIL